MFITRKAEFSASHICRSHTMSEEENRAFYGLSANPHGHGHNYVLEVTLEGEPDPITGMVLDLKRLKEIVNEQVVEPMDTNDSKAFSMLNSSCHSAVFKARLIEHPHSNGPGSPLYDSQKLMIGSEAPVCFVVDGKKVQDPNLS